MLALWTTSLRRYDITRVYDSTAPAAARDATATRIETLKQAACAKEPVHVQLVKVQAALTARGGVCGEEAQRGLGGQRSRRQGGSARAEPQDAHGGTHGEGLHGCGRAHDRRTGGRWSGTMLVVPGLVGSGINRAMVWRRNGRPSMVERRQPLEWMWRVSGALCLGCSKDSPNGFAAGTCVDGACDACDAEHIQTEPMNRWQFSRASLRQEAPPRGGQNRVRSTLVQSSWPRRSRTARTS